MKKNVNKYSILTILIYLSIFFVMFQSFNRNWIFLIAIIGLIATLFLTKKEYFILAHNVTNLILILDQSMPLRRLHYLLANNNYFSFVFSLLLSIANIFILVKLWILLFSNTIAKKEGTIFILVAVISFIFNIIVWLSVALSSSSRYNFDFWEEFVHYSGLHLPMLLLAIEYLIIGLYLFSCQRTSQKNLIQLKQCASIPVNRLDDADSSIESFETLKEYEELLEKGIITIEEFETIKKKIL